MLKDLILKNRSYRRFFQDTPVNMDTLKELIGLARLSASGANKQPLKYILSCNRKTNAQIFDQLTWAAALKDWPGPAEGEKPAAYIIILADKTVGMAGVDHGIAATNILLGAVEKGLGGCMMGSVKKDQLRKTLNIDDQYEILLVLAIGKPKDTVIIEDLEPGSGSQYWRDDKQTHHVPKRTTGELILQEYA